MPTSHHVSSEPATRASERALEPLLFEPLLKGRAWGGDRLRGLGKRVGLGSRIGESWELADLPDSIPDGRSRIACGLHAGRTLHELLAERGAEIMGMARLSPEGRFPLLIKFLDAAEHLSVQVHPDAAYAANVPNAHLKTEAWIILDAAPGAVLFRGVRGDVSASTFFADLERGDVIQHLVSVPVEPGDCIYLPSGICHALGAGMLVAEVQTPSDTTFRVFDWNRNDPNRPLHIAEARRCMRFGAAQEDGTPGIVRRKTALATESLGLVTRTLAKTKFFTVESIDARGGSELPIVTNGGPVIWCLPTGEAALHGPSGEALRLRHGDTALMPASLRGWIAQFPVSSTLLRITVPTSLDSAIA
ncbi:MAG: class I mannose-6-phosphate isomerase [Phycisphaerae bacterium]|nr:class I mannose-6-phosphate isomerase [Phycisphaerae bacterium]